MAEDTAVRIAKSGASWTAFLDTAARLYKRPYNEQLLIHAQRPDASVCASLKDWNEKMYCWVNRGAKGIALIDSTSERPKLKYVFDVSDVHKARRIGRDPYIWELKEEQKEAVLARLEQTYGGTDSGQSFEQRIIEVAEKIASDYYRDLLPQIKYAKEGSFLEEMDELNAGICLRDTLASSIAYTVLSRCGVDLDLWRNELDFTHISEFNTPDTLAVIGNATAEMCKPLLLEIGRTVVAQERQAAKNVTRENEGVETAAESVTNKTQKNNKNTEKVLAKETDADYNALKRESEKEEPERSETAENEETEGAAHGTDIREERGLPDTEPDGGRGAGGRADKVWADEEELPEGTQGRDLSGHDTVGKTESALSDDTGAGRTENGLPDRADGGSGGSDGRTERNGSDEVGGHDEQHQTLGGGERTGGADLRLESETQLNSETSEPDNAHDSRETSLSGSFIAELRAADNFMDIQKGILCSDVFLIHKRPEIAGYFQMEQDTRLQTEYLKNSFRMEEFTEFGIGEIRAGYRADEDGLTMWKGHYLTREAETKVSWEDARFFVNSYIEDGEYLLPGEKAEQIDTDGMYRQLNLFTMFSEQVGSIVMKQAEEKSDVPPMTAVPQEQLSEILRSGGGKENSRKRIYAKYRQGKTPEEMAAFLQKEYGTTGKGFEFDGKQVAVWFNKEGMTAGYGTSALENPVFSMDWREIESEIRSQVESGTYIGENEAYLIDETERSRIANYVYFFFRDGMGEMPEELEISNSAFPDSHAHLIELLSDPAGIDMVASHMDKAITELESGEKKMRYRAVYTPKGLREELADLRLPKTEYPLVGSVEIKKEDFITQDEIDYRLGRGSGYEHGAFRIYEYFMEGHDSKDAVKFLQQEYGIGGSSHALPGNDKSYEDHDGKGIRLEKGQIGSPYTEVLLSWKAVEKRIRKLIEEDKYLSPKGKEAYVDYKWERAQKELEKAQAKMERDTKVACKDAIDRAIAEKFDGYRLPKGTAEGIIKEYGMERVSYVLANTVMHRRQEERISPENKEWAKSIEPYAMYENSDIVVASHPAVLNGFINQTRRYIERENKLAAQTAGQELPKENVGKTVTELSFVNEEKEIEDNSNNFPDIDATPVREKLENGGADKEVDAIEESVQDTSGQTDRKLELEMLQGEKADTLGQSDQKPELEVPQEEKADTLGRDDQKVEQPETGTLGHDVQKPDYEVGDAVTIEGTEFIIEDISDREVQMRDPKLLYPIFRVENRENFERLIAEESPHTEEKKQDTFGHTDQRQPTASETTVYQGDKNGLPYDIVVEKLHFDEPEQTEPEKTPQTDKSSAVNFHITDDALGVGTAKEKFQRNVDAIRTLEKIEGENRAATPEEQKILSQYVGWGGLADAFDETKAGWANEYQELKNLLSQQEYASARESTLNAHYTSPTIIRSIYEALEKMGFEKGNILEPAMGIGNFFGMLPEKMQESRLYGVELDGITGRIARQLYPQADIKISGFEKTDYPNDFFDVAVGNVPFGQYKVADKKYDKNNFLIHDYFFAKSLDRVRPGGVVAFVTSKGTMDKKSPEVRKYLAQRAELLGAVRLPNTAFKENAGTEVTSDILFLKKRDRVMDIEPEWVHLAEKDGVVLNSYFADHPEMVVGKMEMVSGPYGMESTCQPDTSRPFAEQLREAVSRIDGEIEAVEIDELAEETADNVIPADPNVKNYSYTLVDDKVYYRENSIMKPVEMPDTMQERIKGMVGIRDCTQELISLQLEEYPDTAIAEKQAELNRLYDSFSKKYGIISSQTNKRAFNQDSSYCLLCSLEKIDDEGNFKGKADMFSKRTIKKAEVVTSVDTAAEALAVSLSERAKVDPDYMAELSGKDTDTIKEELAGIIFQNPVTDRWETADEYLSGNVRDKLETAKVYAENHPEYAVNVQALTQVQPKELDASEIEVRIGATWIEPKYIEDFMRDTFETPQHLFDRNMMGIQFSTVTGKWNVKGKNADHGNSLVNMTYGTSRRNAYTILEDSLNLKDSRVYDTIEEDGKEKRVLNKQETTIASQKQEAVREAFKDWVFRDAERRQDLVGKYNKLFNSTRPREYDGSHLKFPGMTPDIELRPHQLNAVAHQLYGGNTLLAHCVGAGKTFEMIAAAMESKRLGLCQKNLFVVPNHLTEQWAGDFLRLYPGANILAATKKDFEPANRKKFCSRISTGEYDAVIIGHTQFEKIPLSPERQAAIIERQIDEIETEIAMAKADNGERYTIKQMEKSRKALQTRLDKLNDTSRKDDVVTFEQLGVDRLFVDESHNYKNLFLYTKMRNVAGIAQTEAQKSSDMFAKCQYLDEITGGKGITFATGTPISNSMTELYTNMRYLQYSTLQKLGLGHFDSWASSFGETQTAIDIACQL